MTKVVKVEYDADANVLRLEEPLEGVADHARMQVTLERPANGDRWASLRANLTPAQIDELASLIEEEFPIEK